MQIKLNNKIETKKKTENGIKKECSMHDMYTTLTFGVSTVTIFHDTEFIIHSHSKCYWDHEKIRQQLDILQINSYDGNTLGS